MLLRVLALLVFALLVPQSAQAWTRAHVREAHARVELTTGAPAHVQLELLVDVQGGWLERLELPGLDEELTLAGPAEVTLDSGPVVTARTEVRAGVVVLRFERKDGVRRGVHRVQLRYQTNLTVTASERAGEARLGWVMPGWEAGLLAADVTVVGPEGLAPVHDGRIAQEVHAQRVAGTSEVKFTRIHVPRQSPWHVAVVLSQDALGAQALPTRDGQPSASHGARLGWLLSLGSLLLAWIGRSYVRRRLSALGLRAQSWTGQKLVSTWGPLCCAGLAALAYERAPGLALAPWSLVHLLALERSAGPRGPLALGAFRAVSRRERTRMARARWLELLGVPGADVMTFAGLVTLCALGALTAFARGRTELEELTLLACISALSLVGSSRLRLPRSLSEQLSLLMREAARLRVVSCAMNVVWYVTASTCEQPRLRLAPGARYPGLLRLEVLIDTRRAASPYVLSVLVASDSPAERWTSALWPSAWREQSAGLSRTALLQSVDDVGGAVEELLEHFSRESERLLVQLSQASQRAA